MGRTDGMNSRPNNFPVNAAARRRFVGVFRNRAFVRCRSAMGYRMRHNFEVTRQHILRIFPLSDLELTTQVTYPFRQYLGNDLARDKGNENIIDARNPSAMHAVFTDGEHVLRQSVWQ
jgi:hypothetical protein